jgi:hypothetical protein
VLVGNMARELTRHLKMPLYDEDRRMQVADAFDERNLSIAAGAVLMASKQRKNNGAGSRTRRSLLGERTTR